MTQPLRILPSATPVLAALLLFCGGSAGLGAAPVALKEFARHDEFLAAQISPAGDYLAVAMLVEGQSALGIIDLKKNKVSGQLRFPKGNEVASFAWVNPTRVVVSVAKSFGPLDQPALTGELYAINADGTQRTYLFGYRGADHVGTRIDGVKAEYASAFLFNTLLDDPVSALVSIYGWRNSSDARGVREPRIEKLNVYSGKRDRVTVVPGYEPIQVSADRAGRLRFAVSSDEDYKAHLYARVESGWREIPHPVADRDSFDLHGATADGSAVFLSYDPGNGRECLREYRVDSGILKDRHCSISGAVGEPISSLDRNALIGILHEEGKPEFEVLDPKHPDALLLRSLMKAFGNHRVRITSSTDDGKHVVVQVSSDRNPGDFYLVDRGTLKAKYLVSRRAWIDPAAMAPSEPVTYKTRDGATIHGYLTAKAGLATRKAPLVLMPHGGPHGPRDYWEWHPWPQALASRDYAVLQVNYRGSGGYGLAHQYAGYRKWGTLMQDDLTDAVRWAVEQGIADPGRVCIMGGSYGGYAALMSPVREPDLYRCAIGLAGVYDLVTQSEDSDIAESRFGRQYLQEVLGDTAAMREHSPITYLERLKVPVLIAHGTADERVPFSQAKQLRKAMEKLGKPYEWAEYKDEQHGFYKESNHEDFLKKSIEFLDKHIGPQAAAAAPAGR
jgi:dipeptidyl aminopeptidase/acylaminoacyl peptidase